MHFLVSGRTHWSSLRSERQVGIGAGELGNKTGEQQLNGEGGGGLNTAGDGLLQYGLEMPRTQAKLLIATPNLAVRCIRFHNSRTRFVQRLQVLSSLTL